MIILAAGLGKRLMPLTAGLPKCLVPLHGRPLLDWQMSSARRAGVKEFILVGGYRAGLLGGKGAEVVLNPHYETTNMVESLWCARAAFDRPFLLSYGDILCTPDVVSAAAASPENLAVVVDRRWRAYWEQRFEDPLKDAESLRVDPDGLIRSIGQKTATLDEIQAQFIGLLAFTPAGANSLMGIYEKRRAETKARNMFMTDLLQAAIDSGVAVRAVPVDRGWYEVDSVSDLKIAEASTAPHGDALEMLH